VVTKNNIRAVTVAQGEVLEPAVRAWTRLLDNRQRGTEAGAKRLFEQVMQPVLDALPPKVHSLVVVPDGPLHRLPLEALSETGGPPYLAEHMSIATVPGVGVAAAPATASRSRRSRTCVREHPEGPAVPVAESRGGQPGQLAALLHAREEAQAAVDAFPQEVESWSVQMPLPTG
jgi:CHAT domain-containing protein